MNEDELSDLIYGITYAPDWIVSDLTAAVMGLLERAWNDGRLAGSGKSVVSALCVPNPYAKEEAA